MTRHLANLSILLLAALLAGCATDMHRRKMPMVAAYEAGRADEAAASLEKLLADDGDGNRVMWRLECGSMAFSRGDYNAAIEHFKDAEELIAEYDGRATVSLRDTAAATGSLLLNDESRGYRGSCRDRIALCFYKALAYLGAGREDAFRAQVRRLRDAQKEAQDQYSLEVASASRGNDQARQDHPEVQGELPDGHALAAYGRNSGLADVMAQCDQLAPDADAEFLNPAALFLSGLSSLRDDNPGSAAIDFRRMVAAHPGSVTLRQWLQQAQTRLQEQSGQPSAPPEDDAVAPLPFPLDRQCLYIIFAHGRSATLTEGKLFVPLPAGLVPLAWSMCTFYPSPFSGITAATADGRSDGELLASMDAIMAREYKQAMPSMVSRMVLRAAIYAVSSEVIRQSNMNSAVKFLTLLTISLTAATFNSADTRSWELLPKELMLAQLPMPADRRLDLSLHCIGAPDLQVPVNLEPGFGSAIVYVNAPSHANVSVHVLPLGR